MDKRTTMFGKLMPKEPTSEVLVDRYHVVNRVFDLFPEERGNVVFVGDDYATCSNGKHLMINTE